MLNMFQVYVTIAEVEDGTTIQEYRTIISEYGTIILEYGTIICCNLLKPISSFWGGAGPVVERRLGAAPGRLREARSLGALQEKR